jgi:predicted hydrocarbon binding protein
MPVKDRVVNWFIKNIIIPKREIIDKPGFIINTFTQNNQTTYLRELFLSENLIELIENRIVEKYGSGGKKVLYSAGKKFGYLYSSMSNFPTINSYSREQLSDFAYFFIRFCESTYAKQADYEINFDDKSFSIFFKDYIICRHNGLGHIMSEGGSAGIWAYEMQDKTIEAIQIECQGRGDERCYIYCAPNEKITERIENSFTEQDLKEYKFDLSYKKINEIRPTNYSKNSLKNLIDAGFFKYKEGILSYKNIRFFSCESHLLYLLEREISTLPEGDDFLFDICFEYGKIVREIYGKNDFNKFISDYYPALGFGDIFISSKKNYEIIVNYYPWSVFSEESKYIIFRGVMSGIISSSLGKTIKFKNFDITIRDFLTLKISE